MDVTNDDYTRLLSALLPPGPAWSASDPAIAGAAPSLTRVHQRADALMRELDPRTTTELINRWERLCGLPDECIPAGTQTLRQRQQRLDAKVNLAGGINEDFYLAQLAALGRPDATITRYDKSTFTCSSACTDAVNAPEWRYYWQVNMPAATNTTWMTCGDPCDSALRIWGDTVVECVLNKLCPSHTYVIFKYPEKSMHRIDTKTAQKDKFGAGKNGFTRGNPQTGTPATDLDDDYFDMLQEELCSVVEASGASLEKARHDQLLTALRALLLSRKNPFGDIKSDGTVQTALENLQLRESFTGVVGQAVNQKMSVAIASASATFTADQVIVGESLSGKQYRVSSVSETINLTTTGAGGMDTGEAPASGWVAIYLIYNPTTNTSALLGVNTTTVVAPTVYGGANMPEGYTASALVSVWRTTSGSLLLNGYQRGRKFCIPRVDVLTTSSNPGPYSPIPLSAAVPLNAIAASGYAFCNSGSGSGFAVLSVGSDANGLGYFQVYAGLVGSLGSDIYFENTLAEPQKLYYTFTWTTPAVSNATIGISGYTI